MSPILIVAGFIAGAAAVVLAGVRLARSGDVIAARTRLGGLWVGSVFLAVATSLPELATDISAVRLDAPDLAAGDLFGSSMANMLILALVSLVPGADLFRRAALDNGLSAALAITLTGTAVIFILLPAAGTSLLGVGPGSLLLAFGYVAGTRAIFRNSAIARKTTELAEMAGAREEREGAAPLPQKELPSLRRAIATFVGAALVILVAAPIFAASAQGLAELTGLATSFVGAWLVGFATSLPELVTSLTAVRMGAFDLAVGNLFGSNSVNMAMFALLDLAYAGGPILAAISETHAVSALTGIILMAVGIAAIVYRARGRAAMLEPSSALMILIYLLGLGAVFLHSSAP